MRVKRPPAPRRPSSVVVAVAAAAAADALGGPQQLHRDDGQRGIRFRLTLEPIPTTMTTTTTATTTTTRQALSTTKIANAAAAVGLSVDTAAKGVGRGKGEGGTAAALATPPPTAPPSPRGCCSTLSGGGTAFLPPPVSQDATSFLRASTSSSQAPLSPEVSDVKAAPVGPTTTTTTTTTTSLHLTVKVLSIESETLKTLLLGPGAVITRSEKDGSIIIPASPRRRALSKTFVHRMSAPYARQGRGSDSGMQTTTTTSKTASQKTATASTTNSSASNVARSSAMKQARPLESAKVVAVTQGVCNIPVMATATAKRRSVSNAYELHEESGACGSSDEDWCMSTHKAPTSTKRRRAIQALHQEPSVSTVYQDHMQRTSPSPPPPSSASAYPPISPFDHIPPATVCHFCGIRKTGQWRRGPAGMRTLCNACGINWSKKCKAHAIRKGCTLAEAEAAIGCDRSKFRRVVMKVGGDRDSAGGGGLDDADNEYDTSGEDDEYHAGTRLP